MLRLNVNVDIIQTVGFTLGEGDGMNVSVGLTEGERDEPSTDPTDTMVQVDYR